MAAEAHDRRRRGRHGAGVPRRQVARFDERRALLQHQDDAGSQSRVTGDRMSAMQRPNIATLEGAARILRFGLIEMSHRGGTTHLASSMSWVEILVAAYWMALK